MRILAPLAPLCARTWMFGDKRVNSFIDNNADGNALIKGGCANDFVAATVCLVGELVGLLALYIWIGRVGSEVNPSDPPNGMAKLPLRDQ